LILNASTSMLKAKALTLVHSVSAFAFNMLVLALSINLTAGAIQ